MKKFSLLMIVLIQFIFSGLVFSQKNDTLVSTKYFKLLEKESDLNAANVRVLEAKIADQLKIINSNKTDISTLKSEIVALKSTKSNDSTAHIKDLAEWNKLKLSSTNASKELADWKSGKNRLKTKTDTIIPVGILNDLIDYKTKNPVLPSDKSIVNKKDYAELTKFKNANSGLSLKNIKLEEVNAKTTQNLKISRDSVTKCLAEKATLINEKTQLEKDKAKILAQRDSAKSKNEEKDKNYKILDDNFKLLTNEKAKVEQELIKSKTLIEQNQKLTALISNDLQTEVQFLTSSNNYEGNILFIEPLKKKCEKLKIEVPTAVNDLIQHLSKLANYEKLCNAIINSQKILNAPCNKLSCETLVNELSIITSATTSQNQDISKYKGLIGSYCAKNDFCVQAINKANTWLSSKFPADAKNEINIAVNNTPKEYIYLREELEQKSNNLSYKCKIVNCK